MAPTDVARGDLGKRCFELHDQGIAVAARERPALTKSGTALIRLVMSCVGVSVTVQRK